VIHVWDWWQSLDAHFVEAFRGTPILVSDMNMSVSRLLPRSPATTFGTPQLVDEARRQGFARAELLLPPVDCALNAPGVVDTERFRARFGIGADEFLLVTVSRIDPYLKGDSLRRTVTAMREVGRGRAVRLVIVGDGPLRGELESLADQANREAGRTAVSLVGAMLDPREAYAAADAVVGMGGSALRGMAFAKPVVIVGAGGFAELFSEQNAARFHYQGFYGEDWATSDDRLHRRALLQLVSRDISEQLGQFSRQFVREHFALDRVGTVLVRLLAERVSAGTKRWRLMLDGVRTAAVMVRERRGMSYRLQKGLGLAR
jgi:glycosyltransferase involved in cell wall biosynthesis